MKKLLVFGVVLSAVLSVQAQLPMGGWRMHLAYGNVSRIENGNEKVFALSYGALMSVDKEDGQMEYYNKLTGLSSSNILNIKYDRDFNRLIIVYADGNIDFLYENGDVVNIIDLYSSQTSENKLVNDLTLHDKTMYMAMKFGLLEVDLQRRVLKETYYIGEDAQPVDVKYVAVCSDTLYAATADKLYSAGIRQNKIDYHNWNTASLPGSGTVGGLHTCGGDMYILRGGKLFRYAADGWHPCLADSTFSVLSGIEQKVTLLADSGMFVLTSDTTAVRYPYFYGSEDVAFDAASNTYWYAYGEGGIATLDPVRKTYNTFHPNGPIVNTPYRMRVTGNRLYIVLGGYWTGKNNTPATVMIYEKGEWTNYNSGYFAASTGAEITDFCDILAYPKDNSHFFIGTACRGLIEFRDNEFYKLYDTNNSPIINFLGNPNFYTWVDGLDMDADGNLWMMNLGGGIYVLTAESDWTKWILFNNETLKNLTRCKQVLISNQNQNLKIFINNHHSNLGIGVLNDNGTIDNMSDDKIVFRNYFVDQNGKDIKCGAIYSVEQDVTGELWVGTDAGLFIIPDVEKMFTSNECRRVIIPRTDGSGLADYLLGDEAINAIAVDGANRKWIGTQNSGAFLVSPDGIETVEHFTMDNSPLPENAILSIAINPTNGEVFIGTGLGLVSYQSNAAEPEPEIPNKNLYVYPNPVREDFEGVITINGLRDNTTVKITDAAGMLVAETSSLGGLATWDGNDMNGSRVRTGVYLAQCITSDGEQYALTKILIVK